MKIRKNKTFTLEELSKHGWEMLDFRHLPKIFFRKGNKEMMTEYHLDLNESGLGEYKIINIIKFDVREVRRGMFMVYEGRRYY